MGKRYFCRLLLLLFLLLQGCNTFSSLGNGKTALNAGREKNRRCPDVRPLTDQVVADSLNVSLERLAALKTNRSLSNSDICAMPDAGLKRAFARLDKPKADHPGEWAEFRNMQRRSEDGKVKPDGLIKGIQKRKKLLKEFAVRAAAAATAVNTSTSSGTDFTPPAAGVASDQWTTLGPGNIGGRIRAIAIHPTDTNKIWLGSVAGGIWRRGKLGEKVRHFNQCA